MKELVAISGKGGTGKTSITASLAVLSRGHSVVADCDVDAADLHLILDPRDERREDFVGGSKARIKSGHCAACGTCAELCRFDAVFFDGPGNGRLHKTYRIDTLACEGCGVCAHFCEHDAIKFAPAVCGQWFVSRTRCGPLVHARMVAGAENSGKLVTVIRQQAHQIAKQRQLDLILCDGSPGIGCPVIASLTSAQLALIVLEPTLSGLHDFRRVAQLTRQLNVPGLLVVNKADLNEQIASELENEAAGLDIPCATRIPYDPAVTRAQNEHLAVVESSDGPASVAIRRLWGQLQDALNQGRSGSSGHLVQLHVE